MLERGVEERGWVDCVDVEKGSMCGCMCMFRGCEGVHVCMSGVYRRRKGGVGLGG